MILRELSEEDLTECLSLIPSHLGDEIVGRSRAVEVWRGLVRNRMFRSAVLHSATATGCTRICGFGCSVFVSKGFADQELARPQPFLNSRVIASLAEDNSVVLSERGLSSQNDGAGLDILVFCGGWLSEGLTAEQELQAQILLPSGFVEVHRGYLLNRIFSEAVGEVHRNFLTSSGVWRIVAEFPGSDRALTLLSSESAFAVSGSLAATLFHYEPPTLGLRDSDKHLLSETLQGGSDIEIASRMNLSLASVKKRWQALFERVAQNNPALLQESENRGIEGGRGSQKRHHVLAYVRCRPQELRPYGRPR